MNCEKMRQLREEHGLTQVELGNRVYVTGNMICMVEKGLKTPSLPLLERIAEALGVTSKDLM